MTVYCRRWRNAAGHVRWQPCVDQTALWELDGIHRWLHAHAWHPTSHADPVLYRSHRYAMWVARRRADREARTTWQPAELESRDD